MKKLLLMFILFSCLTGFSDIPSYQMISPDNFQWPKALPNCDVSQINHANINLHKNGIFRVKILDGGGQGGLIWKLQQKDDYEDWKDISGEIFGFGALAEPYDGWAQLLVRAKCGWQIGSWQLYRYDGKKYVCIRHERYDYKNKELTTLGEKSYDLSSYAANLYRLEKRLRLALDLGDNEDQWLDVVYPDKGYEQFGACTFKYAVNDNIFQLTVLPQPVKGFIEIFAVNHMMNSNSTMGISYAFGDKINPELRMRIEKAVCGTFTLIVSNQTLREGDAPVLTIAIDGILFAKERIQSDKSVIQHTLYAYPTFLSDGKHTLKVTGGGVDLEKEFVVDQDNDVGLLFFDRYPWYKFWKDANCSFGTCKGPLLWR